MTEGILLKATTTIICGENDKLRQVIVNCLLNAADAIISKLGKADHRTIQIATSNQRDPLLQTNESSLVITITDNGCGIPQDLIDSAFDPFFTTKEPGAGTGLGLSVSQALIESMGGRILHGNIEKEGTTIQILVPFVGEE